MLKQFSIILGVLFVLVACSSGPKKPKNLISKKQMVSILIDAKLISSANSVNKKIMEESGVFPNTYIFNKYRIDSVQFAESNEYYTYRVKDYEEIYEMVKDSLDRLKVKYKEIEKQEKQAIKEKQDDSLKTISKKRDSLKFGNLNQDSLAIKKIEEQLLKEELEDLEIDDELELIEPVSDK